MDFRFIESLHCPYTGSAMTAEAVVTEPVGGIDYGVVASEAGEFPIVSGILRLRVDELRLPIVDLVKTGRYGEALRTAMEVPFHGRRAAAINWLTRAGYFLGARRVAAYATAYKRLLFRPLEVEGSTFARVLSIARHETGAGGQLYRFSMPTFLPVYPLIHLIKPGASVLDFGSGTGHGAFLISRLCPGAAVTCADYSFSVLYLAKRYFLSNARFVCLDGNFPLPFASSSFSHVFSSDALHLIDGKLGLAKEFERCLDETGTVVLPHLHNQLFPAKFGKSLTPRGYARLFADMYCRVYAEDDLVRQYLCEDVLDLEQAPPLARLDASVQGVSVVASKDRTVFRRYRNLWARHIGSMEHPTLNPVYEIVPGTGVSLRKKVNGAFGGVAQTWHGVTYLPDTVKLADIEAIDRASLLALKQSDRPRFDELARRFIVIEAPERFV